MIGKDKLEQRVAAVRAAARGDGPMPLGERIYQGEPARGDGVFIPFDDLPVLLALANDARADR
jgi:hypothetical protein